MGRSRVCVKTSPAFGRRRLHTNTDYFDLALFLILFFFDHPKCLDINQNWSGPKVVWAVDWAKSRRAKTGKNSGSKVVWAKSGIFPLGLGRCLWLMLVLFCLCLIVLLGVIFASLLSGVGLGSCGDIWLTDHWRNLAFTPFLVKLLMDVLDTVRFI